MRLVEALAYPVASRVEARIETRDGKPGQPDPQVASRVEARIETVKNRPGQMAKLVASRVEARIETRLPMAKPGRRSPPAWRRGLKPSKGCCI